MKSSNILKNEKGLAGILMTLLVAIVIGMLIFAVKARMADLTRDFGRHKALFDAEVAVEKFAIILKEAYDRGSNFADLQNTSSTFVCNAGPSLANGIQLCWPSTGNTVCVERNPNPGGAAPICIENNSDYLFTLKSQNPSELEVTFKRKKELEISQTELALEAIHEIAAEAGIVKAYAALDTYRPPLPAVLPSNTIEYSMPVPGALDCTYGGETAACNAYRSAPKPYICDNDPNNPVRCLKIKFCVKFTGTCDPDPAKDEFIRQTYMFFKAPDNSMGY